MIERDVELACEEIERLEAALATAEAKLEILTAGINQLLKDMEAVK
jgi:hypothetical protein